MRGIRALRVGLLAWPAPRTPQKTKTWGVGPRQPCLAHLWGLGYQLWFVLQSLRLTQNHSSPFAPSAPSSAGLLRQAWCRNAPSHKNKNRSWVPLLPSPPLLGAALSSLACTPSAWVRSASRQSAFSTPLRAQGFTAQIAASVAFSSLFVVISGGYLRKPCSARARLAPFGLLLVGCSPHTSGLACLVGALNAKR